MKSDIGLFEEFKPYWNTVWLLLAVGFFGHGLESLIGYRSVGFLFLFAVLVVGFLARLGPVLFAATFSWLSWNYFFIPPRFTFAIETPEDAFMCATYFFVALATGVLANRIKQQESLIREREERTNLLYEVMLELSASENKSQFLTTIAARLAHVLIGECGILLKSPNGGLETSSEKYAFNVSSRELEAAKRTLETGQLTGWSKGISGDGFEDIEALYLPLKGNNETVGVFRYKPLTDSELTVDQENLLQSVCRQVGISLEQRLVRKRLSEAKRLRESEKMHQTLLNSVSHELRTPLAAIVVSASSLDNEYDRQTESSRKTLTHELKTSAERLNRVVENLLDMSRLSASGLALKKEWHDVEDLIGVTAARVQESLGRRDLKLDIEQDLPLVEIDFRLMEHALFNLLANAFIYSPKESEVVLKAWKNETSVLISVEDSGRGIDEKYFSEIFERFFRAPNSPPGGTGLGLSIVKSIAEFHGGRVAVENRIQGGAKFLISIPSSASPEAPPEAASEISSEMK